MAILDEFEKLFGVSEADAVAESEPAPAPEPFPADPSGVTLWDVSTWNDMPNYTCGVCPFSSLDEDEIGAHVYAQHLQNTPVESPKPRVDRYGNLT